MNERKSITERLWAKVDKTPGHGPDGDCWLWTGGTNGRYGVFRFRERQSYVHRIVWSLHHGEEPGEHIHHRCEMPLCVNPHHLESTTEAEHHRLHMKSTCKHGHPFTPENTYIAFDHKRGRHFRQCRICRRSARARSYKPRPHKVPVHLAKQGADHPKAKLTDAQVIEILYDPAQYRDIGARYGISPQTVSAIKNGYSWKHITKDHQKPRKRRASRQLPGSY